MDSLTTVQNKVKHLGRTKCIEAPIFAGLVAYIGEVMMAQIPNSQGQMRQSDQFPDTWEPWIVDPQGSICNPWSYLYDMLAEPSGGISIPHAAALAVQQRSVPHPHNASAPVLMGRLSVQTKDST